MTESEADRFQRPTLCLLFTDGLHFIDSILPNLNNLDEDPEKRFVASFKASGVPVVSFGCSKEKVNSHLLRNVSANRNSYIPVDRRSSNTTLPTLLSSDKTKVTMTNSLAISASHGAQVDKSA